MKSFLKKIIATMGLTLLVGAAVGFSHANHQTVLAADGSSSATWTEPVLTLGTSLTAAQKQGTIDTLTAKISGNYQTITVNGATLVKYLNPSGSTFTTSSGVWSSALIEKTATGTGINVQILNYNGRNNITTITADQYKNAALTAGVTDANIYVTSATPIDGSGALAGVYAAYASTGNTLNQSQVTAAQEEMSTLSDINSANKDKDGYSDAQLNNAVAAAKKEMAEKGSNISTGDITTIVNNQLTNNGIINIITDNQKTQIINMLVKIRDSGALDSAGFKEQASKLISNIQTNAKSIFNKLDTEENRNFLQKIGDQLGKFFQSLWQTISGWFK
ncbi:DUF1002 domain-containing protein [Lapidilactobacillus achengensis]|uniref:DUF1002 domain-containing protein n=1 Tax=Lapidilactobacillus achengensis TaxID=2486000 RepID=A0ABW1UL02_9LACO|nr:DUF1002 domain-containing protein [Lapidilactobacillus achengensis]